MSGLSIENISMRFDLTERSSVQALRVCPCNWIRAS
jgi:hypothetical protein